MHPVWVRRVPWILAAVMLSAMVGIAGARSTPILVVTPNEAPAGSEVAVAGTGLPAGETLRVYLDHRLARAVPVGADGHIAVHLTLPAGAFAGQHWVSLVRSTGRAVVQAPVWVTPLTDARWSTSIRDLDAKEQVFWTDVHGEYAWPVGVDDGVVVAVWRGSVEGPDYAGGRTTIVALDGATGELRWSYRLDGRGAFDPFLVDGRVIVIADLRRADEFVALDSASGTVDWSVLTDRAVWDPVLAGRTLAVLSHGKSVIEGSDATTGHAIWTYRVGTHTRVSQPDVGSMLATEEGIWVLADVEGTRWLILLDPATGLERRRLEVPRSVGELVAAVGETLYVSGWSGEAWTGLPSASGRSLGALDAIDGRLLWVRSVMPSDCRTPSDRCIPRGIDVVANDRTVIVRSLVERAEKDPCPLGCAFGRTILALEPETGALRWQRTLEKDWEGGPGLTLVGDTLYTTDVDLRAIWVVDGSTLWSVSAPASPEHVGVGRRFSDQGLAVGADVLFGTWAGSIVARTATVTGPAPVFEVVEPSPPPTPAPTQAPLPAPTDRATWLTFAPVLLGLALVAALSIGIVVWARARRRGRPLPATREHPRPSNRTPTRSR